MKTVFGFVVPFGGHSDDLYCEALVQFVQTASVKSKVVIGRQ